MAVTIVVQRVFANSPSIISFSDDEEPFETATVSDLKKRLSRSDANFRRLLDRLNLRFDGILLSDEELLSAYGITDMSVIQASISLSGGGTVPQLTTHGMGDATGRNASKEQLYDFDDPSMDESASSSGSSSPSIGAKSKNH